MVKTSFRLIYTCLVSRTLAAFTDTAFKGETITKKTRHHPRWKSYILRKPACWIVVYRVYVLPLALSDHREVLLVKNYFYSDRWCFVTRLHDNKNKQRCSDTLISFRKQITLIVLDWWNGSFESNNYGSAERSLWVHVFHGGLCCDHLCWLLCDYRSSSTNHVWHVRLSLFLISIRSIKLKLLRTVSIVIMLCLC